MSDTADQGYTLREAAQEIGASVPWFRKQVYKGALTPPLVEGSHGKEYRLTAADLEAARGLYHARGGTGKRTDRLTNTQALALVTKTLEQAQEAVAVARALADERGEALARERERADRLEQTLVEERERRERLQGMGALAFLFGGRRRI